MEELDLVDIYRKLHPNAKAFTYESKSLKIKSRIDCFLVSNTINGKYKKGRDPTIYPRGGTPLYGLYRYVRPQRVWFFSRFGHR